MYVIVLYIHDLQIPLGDSRLTHLRAAIWGTNILGGRVKGSQWPPQYENSMTWGERIKSQPSCVRLTEREERQQLACPGSQ